MYGGVQRQKCYQHFEIQLHDNEYGLERRGKISLDICLGCCMMQIVVNKLIMALYSDTKQDRADCNGDPHELHGIRVLFL